MNPPPRFLSVDDVLTLHAIAIENQGGDSSLRDRALLESAVATPAQQFSGQYAHEDIPAMAAAYAFHICKNHPFVDGNKRAGAAAMIAFLSDNGWAFDATADDAEPVILQLAAGELDKAVFTNWARTHMREKPKMELRDFFAQLTHSDFEKTVSLIPKSDTKEMLASLRESIDAMPLIADVQQHRESLIESNDQLQLAFTSGVLATFVGLYRIAEDMGYEW